MIDIEAFPLELDHIGLLVSENAPERSALETLGLREAGHEVDQGSFGLRSRFYTFENMYLELLWPSDRGVATRVLALAGLDLGTRERWRESNAVPVGLVFRRREESQGPVPFHTHTLHGRRGEMPLDLEFNAEIPYEPWNIVIPQHLSFQPGKRPFDHPAGVRRITEVRITVAEDRLSALANLLNLSGEVNLQTGLEPLLELSFDGGLKSKVLDTRPILPLVLRI
jgi:hypothetical protein